MSEEIIRQQNDKIEKYEKKLKALIHAYKSLQAEKSVLEETVKALSLSGVGSSDLSQQIENVTTIDNQTENVKRSPIEGDSLENDSLKLSTLKNALSVISSEKTKQEQAFTEDRKRLLDDMDQVSSELASKISQLNELMILSKNQASELDRNKQSLEQKNDELERLHKRTAELEISLKDEILADSLKSQIETLKASFTATLKVETEKYINIKKDLEDLRSSKEEAAATMEKRIGDLTAMLCDHEKTNRELLEMIDDLKNQNQSKISSSKNVDMESLSICKENLLKTMKEQPDADPLKLLGLGSTRFYHVFHARCRSEYDALLEKLNIAELTANSKRTTTPETIDYTIQQHSIDELQHKIIMLEKHSSELKQQFNHELKAKDNSLLALEENYLKRTTALEAQYTARLNDLDFELTKQRERATKLLEEKNDELQSLKRTCEASFPTSKNDHRDISLSVASDGVVIRSESQTSFNSVDESLLPSTLRLEFNDSFVSQQNHQTPLDPLHSPSFMPLHYSKELVQKDLKIHKARSELRRLENQLVAVQHELISKELTQREIVEKLKDEIRSCESKLARLNALTSRDSALDDAYNETEYVKNVFVHFASSPNPSTKLHMLKALCSAFKMNVKETDTLIKTYAKNFGIRL